MGEDELKIELINKDTTINTLIPVMCKYSIEPDVQGEIITCLLNMPTVTDKNEEELNMMTNEKASKVFGNIIGTRFDNEEAIERWIRAITGCELKGLVIGKLRHPKDEPEMEDLMTDDFMDCTFGENECGKDYADFILHAIKTNANQLYITEADWMY